MAKASTAYLWVITSKVSRKGSTSASPLNQGLAERMFNMDETIPQRHVIHVTNDPLKPDHRTMQPEVYGSVEDATSTMEAMKAIFPECTYLVLPITDPAVERWHPVICGNDPATVELSEPRTLEQLIKLVMPTEYGAIDFNNGHHVRGYSRKGMDYIISCESVENLLFEDEDHEEYLNDETQNIDEQIGFYVPDVVMTYSEADFKAYVDKHMD